MNVMTPRLVPIRKIVVVNTIRKLQDILIFFKSGKKPPMKQSISEDPDGFEVRRGKFILADTWNLDLESKRAVTISNLFVNHKYGISEIARALNENRRDIIFVLLKQGIIRDRRVRQMGPLQGVERRISDYQLKREY
jgi:hypothetical protein